MPGFFHKELRRVWASLNVNTGARDPVDRPWRGRPAGETHLSRLLAHQLPDRRDALPPDARPATDRSGGEEEARLVLDRD